MQQLYSEKAVLIQAEI